MGSPGRWVDQTPGCTLPALIAEVRKDIRSGHFNKKDWDHNHPDRTPARSNKQVRIWAFRALGLGPGDDDISQDRAWDVIIDLAVGGN